MFVSVSAIILFWLEQYGIDRTKFEDFLYTCGFCWYIGIMVMLILDRLLFVHYNIRYVVKWTKNKTKTIIFSIALFSIALAIAFEVFLKRKLMFKIRLHFWSISICIFLVTALVTYAYILNTIIRRRFRNQIKSKQKQAQTSSNIEQPSNIRYPVINFRKTLMVPSLIILTFLIFWTVPVHVIFFRLYTRNEYENEVFYKFYPLISYAVGFISDALIYIIFQPSIWKTFKKIFHFSYRKS